MFDFSHFFSNARENLKPLRKKSRQVGTSSGEGTILRLRGLYF
jgi:hypothetical protein